MEERRPGLCACGSTVAVRSTTHCQPCLSRIRKNELQKQRRDTQRTKDFQRAQMGWNQVRGDPFAASPAVCFLIRFRFPH